MRRYRVELRPTSNRNQRLTQELRVDYHPHKGLDLEDVELVHAPIDKSSIS